MARILEQLSLEGVTEAHLFVLRRFEEDRELCEKLQPDFYASPAGWIAEIAQARRMGWLGRLQHTYVGFVDLAVEDGEGLAYLSIYVTPEYRQMGVGSAMVRMLAPGLGELGVQALLAETEADNWPARRCLRRAGFRPLGSEEEPVLEYALGLSPLGSC